MQLPKCRITYLIIGLLLFINLPIANGQNNCVDVSKIIPTYADLYMIGEIHLDQDAPTLLGNYYINKSTIIENQIRQFLVDSCGVNHFTLELPACYEYFINLYVATGDTTWIHDFDDQPYFYNRIKNFRQLYLKNNGLKISCIDIDYPKYSNKVAFCLMSIAFFEHYSSAFFPPYVDEVAIPASANLNIPIWIVQQDTTNITPTIKPFLTSIIKFCVPELFVEDEMYATFLATLNNKELLKALSTFLGKDYLYAVRVMENYVYGFNIDFLSSEMLVEREPKLFNTVNELIYNNPNSVFCIQGGDIHTSEAPELNMLRYRLSQALDYSIFSFHLYPKNFSRIIEDIYHLTEPLDYNYEGVYCTYKLNEDDYGIKIQFDYDE